MIYLIIAIIAILATIAGIGLAIFVWVDYWRNGIFGIGGTLFWSIVFGFHAFILGFWAIYFWGKYIGTV